MVNKFSHIDFRQKLQHLNKNLKICDYLDVNDKTKSFCIIRHDIEYSVDRALDLALIEKELGISASYFLQIRNNTYNALSNINVKKIKKIKSLGHKIGLHVYLEKNTSLNSKELEVSKLKQMISSDILVLENFLDFEVDRFSYHRPSMDLLRLRVEIPNKINAYDKKYFTVFGSETPGEDKILYLADSNHRWKYGKIEEINFQKNSKVQVLFHPFSWTQSGLGNLNNFKNLLYERYNELKLDIKNEISTFPKEL